MFVQSSVMSGMRKEGQERQEVQDSSSKTGKSYCYWTFMKEETHAHFVFRVILAIYSNIIRDSRKVVIVLVLSISRMKFSSCEIVVWDRSHSHQTSIYLMLSS